MDPCWKSNTLITVTMNNTQFWSFFEPQTHSSLYTLITHWFRIIIIILGHFSQQHLYIPERNCSTTLAEMFLHCVGISQTELIEISRKKTSFQDFSSTFSPISWQNRAVNVILLTDNSQGADISWRFSLSCPIFPLHFYQRVYTCLSI